MVSFSIFALPKTFTLYKCPSPYFQVVNTKFLLSGDQAGCASVKSFFVNRFGFPLGKSITYNLFNAVKANIFPSGDGTASLICVTKASLASLIGYLKETLGPNSIFTSTLNGISVALLVVKEIEYIFPP